MTEEERLIWYQKAGVYFGYPKCCIKFFIESSNEALRNNHDVGNFTGFVPCDEHAKEIREGKITLDSLISNRVCPTKFPYESDSSFHKHMEDKTE